MSNDELKNRILKVVPEAEFSEEGSEFLNVTVTPEHLHKLAEDTAALVFGIFCFLVAARLFFVGDVWVTTIFPNMDWNWMYRLEYLSLYLTPPTFSLFTYFGLLR